MSASGEAPLLTVYGGKITTYRRLAEQALERARPFLQLGPRLDRGCASARRRFPSDGRRGARARARGSWPFLTEAHARRLVRAYGTRVDRILGAARGAWTTSASCFGADLTAAEVRYLMRARMGAKQPDDVLWRRIKLGLRVSTEERERSRGSWPVPSAAVPEMA